jgi:hypothetical protein
MATCPKCGMSFAYTESHICAERDWTKAWLLAAVAAGALSGGAVGEFLATAYVQHAVSELCNKEGAGNLCGLTSAAGGASYLMAGAIAGAAFGVFVAGIIFTALSRRRS